MARESDEDTLSQHSPRGEDRGGSHDEKHDEESGSDGSKESVGFWSPDLKGVRSKVVKKWCLTSQLPDSQNYYLCYS